MARGIMNLRHRWRDAVTGPSLLLAIWLLGGDISAVKAEDAYVCKLFAREYLRTIYIHNLKAPDSQPVDAQQKAIPDTTDTTKLPFYYQKLVATCLASAKVPDLPDVPEATDKVWLQDLIENHPSKASGTPVASRQQDEPAEGSVAISSAEQSKAQDTCGRVNMRVSWTNNGRSWRCIK
jgi:hypothetical protein